MNPQNEQDPEHNRTNLFTVRLWCEEQGDNGAEWRGQITNLHNREVRYFRDPETLYRALLKMASCNAEKK